MRLIAQISAVAWLVLSIGLVKFMANEGWMLAFALWPLGLGLMMKGGIETQIRHLNGLALSPFEKGRTSKWAFARIWLGGFLIIFAFGATIVALMMHLQGALIFAVGVTPAVVGVLLMSFRTGLSWIGFAGLRYDPDDDEFKPPFWSGRWPPGNA